jgi:ATP-dependent helicase/nuclease subunit A
LKFGVEYEAQRLLLTDMITEEQYEMLNFENLKKFFGSNIFKRILSSKRVYREKRFTVEENSSSLLGIGDDPILVQGVIDIFFENEDGTFAVADYKTDRVSSGEEHILVQKYKEQLFYYSKAVEKMTNSKVTERIIYSFALGKEIVV